MLRRLALGGVLAAILATPMNSASAQFRLFRDRKKDRDFDPAPVTTPTETPTVNNGEIETLFSDFNPEHEKLKNQADNAYQQGQYQRVIDLTSAVLREAREDHVAYYLRASARVELGMKRGDAEMIRQGIADARRSVKLDGQEQFMYYLPYLYGMTNLGKVEGRKEHAEVAVQIADQVLSVNDVTDDDRAHIHYQRANAYFYLRRWDRSIADFEKAIELSPRHLGAQLSLAEALVNSERLEKAEDQFDAAVQTFPNNALVYNNRGMFYKKQGRNDDALIDFTRAVEVDSNYFHAITNRGFLLMERGDAKAAEQEFSSSLKINPQQPLVYSLRGTSRLMQGDSSGAIQDYRHVLTLDPSNAVAHSDLGFAKFFAGDYEGAVGNFQQAVKLNRGMTFLYPWEYMSMVMNGDRIAADRKFKAILETVEEKTWVHHMLTYLTGQVPPQALLAEIDGDEEARKAKACEAHYFIGFMLQRAGEQRAAEEHFEKCLATGLNQLSAYRGSQYELNRFRVGL